MKSFKEIYKHILEQSSIDDAASQTEPDPTEAQKHSGNYKKGPFTVDGLAIKIENCAMTYRSGTDSNGKQWKTKMYAHYGYISNTEGKDGDLVDVFIKPNVEADDIKNSPVFIVNQVRPDTQKFDEHKIMLGFDDGESAKRMYLKCYEKGWSGMGEVTEMEWVEFKEWLSKKSNTKKPAV